MKREVTWAEVVLLPVAFAGSAGGLAAALILLFEGRDGLAFAFAAGGLLLAFWTAARAVLAPGR